MDLDGRHRRVVVPEGGTFTPKQVQLSAQTGQLYWCDREGMRVMRCNLDGSRVETLVESGSGDADRARPLHWCVGIAAASGISWNISWMAWHFGWRGLVGPT